jgi:hypothetical protein
MNLVSNVVSFTPVPHLSLQPPGTTPHRSRTSAATGEHRSALLESVLGATPQEFESPILRQAELRKCAADALPEGARVGAVVSILVSIARLAAAAANPLAPTLCLVTAAADGPDPDAARRAGVRLPVHSRTCTSGCGPIVGGKPRPLELPNE